MQSNIEILCYSDIQSNIEVHINRKQTRPSMLLETYFPYYTWDSTMQGNIEAQYFFDMQRNIVVHINKKIIKYICTIDNLLPYYIYEPIYCSVMQGNIWASILLWYIEKYRGSYI